MQKSGSTLVISIVFIIYFFHQIKKWVVFPYIFSSAVVTGWAMAQWPPLYIRHWVLWRISKYTESLTLNVHKAQKGWYHILKFISFEMFRIGKIIDFKFFQKQLGALTGKYFLENSEHFFSFKMDEKFIKYLKS